MIWVEIVIAAFVFYEAVVISIYRLLQQSNSASTLWVVMGSKVIKMMLSIGAIFVVPRVTEIPIRQFALVTVGVYLVSIVVESIFFLKKKQNNEQKQ